jgi:arylsulfatase A-like enzyme
LNKNISGQTTPPSQTNPPWSDEVPCEVSWTDHNKMTIFGTVHMKSKRKIFIWVLIFLSAGMAFLLWPLTSKRFRIEWDQGLIRDKQAFLQYQPIAHDWREKPNILLIVVDDLGKTDITLYGSGKVHTPNIDQLGAKGVIFDQAYTASPVCSPSRAAIFTGRYPQRFGFTYQMHDFYLTNRLMHYAYRLFVNSNPWEPRGIEEVPSRKMTKQQGLPPSEIILSELLKNEGYQTALIGKWHLGNHPRNTPCNFGFDYHYGFYGSHTLYAYEDNPEIVNQRIPNDFSDKYIWKGQRNGPHAIYRNCVLIHEDEYLTQAITRECRYFIQANRDTSFFLIASYNAPHTPLQAPEYYVNQFQHVEDPVKRVYYAMIKSLDDEIGKLLSTLSQFGLDKNTLIFFISDNGGATYTHTTDNAPLRGGKITDFEGGLNVPMILKWENHVPGGVHYSPPVISMDIFSTITSVIHIHLPEDRDYDGINLLPHLTDHNQSKYPHPFLFWNRGNTQAVRSPDYKMIMNTEFGDILLFDMRLNNLEKENILNDHRDLVKELIFHYDRWEEVLSPPLWPPLVYYVYQEDRKEYYFDN